MVEEVKSLERLVIRPKVGSVTNFERVNLTCQYELPGGKIYSGIPLIFNSQWSFDDNIALTKMGVMSRVCTDDFDMMIKFYNEEETHYNVLPIVFGDDDLRMFSEIYSAVPDKTKFKYVMLQDVVGARLLVNNFMENYPGVVVMAGPLSPAEITVFKVPIPIVGFDVARDTLDEMFGIEPELPDYSLADTNFVAAQYSPRNMGEVAKLFALGASFVILDEEMGSFNVEQSLNALRGTCAYCSCNLEDLSASAQVEAV